MKIRAYVPVHAKDMRVLPAVVEGLRCNCDVSGVVVIAKNDLRPQFERLSVSFMDEDRVVDGVRHDSVAHPRWGWYFQQIIKLGVAWHETDDYYLLVDADTVFLNLVPFFTAGGRPLYTEAWEYHQPYLDVFERLLGFKPNREYSFVAHHMVYRGRYVKEMCESFRPHSLWWRNIVDYVEPQPPWNCLSQFAETETYGHYIKARHPEEVNVRRLRWRNVVGYPSRRQIRKLRVDNDFCSFQHYLRESHRLSRPWRVFLSRLKKLILCARQG
jgi:hypothetical protein